MGNKKSTLEDYNLSKKVIIITGASDGIGLELANILTSFHPKRIILPVRNRSKGEKALEYIRTSNGSNCNNVEIWDMDLANLQSVRDFADKFIAEVGELHMLFNNAGIWSDNKKMTDDGFEQHFQINHLSHFLLTALLLPTLKSSASPESPSKVIITSSRAQIIGNVDFENLNGEKISKKPKPTMLYSNTKLMNVMFANELNRRYSNSNIKSTSMHPGLVHTKIFKAERKFVALGVSTVMKLFGTSVEECARNILFPVLSPDIDEGGKYFDCGVEAKVNPQALDQELTNKFWNVSEKLVNKYYINNDNVENEVNLPEGTEHKVMKNRKGRMKWWKVLKG
ncbi:hypothetical protein C2G38_2239912 [Gigaspora rosea]|uniref:NAD(P)-binding protein n=1 Tax=Gigaspora rosea TaxID=44941 RepID=A0A397VZ31_9GLOM|nr:hypothetical protein C2G38_2239912 [Gigaspora rosea]